MQLQPIDDRREVLIAENEEVANLFAGVRFINAAILAIKERGSFSVALSGGSTPKKLYEYIKTSPKSEEVDWSRVNFFWSDERAVPQDHPESNYNMAMGYFKGEPFDLARKFWMPATDENRDLACKNYEAQIKKYCHEGRFDLMLLGVGEDGHTASLFPGSPALDCEDKQVTSFFIPEKNSFRMTLTFSCINNSRKIMVLCYGPNKADILKKVFSSDDDFKKFPAQKIGTKITPALFIVDEIAASTLPISVIKEQKETSANQ